MFTPRLYLDQPLAEGAEVPATAGQAHYLGGVMRRAVDDAVLLFNGRDGEWAASIAGLRKDRCTFRPERQGGPPGAVPGRRLLVAAVKRDAMDWMAEKATELGIGLIQPVLTRRSITDKVNTTRLSSIAQEAAEQCGRLTVPRVAPAAPLHAVLDAWDATPLLVGDERRESLPLAAVVQAMPAGPGSGSWAWLVGPEGGFERAELDDL